MTAFISRLADAFCCLPAEDALALSGAVLIGLVLLRLAVSIARDCAREERKRRDP